MGRRRLRLPFRRRSTRPLSLLVRQQYCPCPRTMWKRRWRSQRAPRKVPRAAMGCRCSRMRHHSPFRRRLMPPCLQSLPASVIGPSRCCCACVGPFLALRMPQPIARWLLLRLCEVVGRRRCTGRTRPQFSASTSGTQPCIKWAWISAEVGPRNTRTCFFFPRCVFCQRSVLFLRGRSCHI